LYKWSKKMTRMRKKKLKMIINCTIRNQNPQLIKKRTMMKKKKKDMKKSKSTITSSSPRQTREGRSAVSNAEAAGAFELQSTTIKVMLNIDLVSSIIFHITLSFTRLLA
jgi:hypothetical protein